MSPRSSKTEPKDSAPERIDAVLHFGIMASTAQSSVDFGRLAIALGDEINKILQNITIKSKISALNVLPSMTESYSFPESIRYHKRNALVSLRFNVPSLKWRELSYTEKVDRLSTKICENVAKIEAGIMSPDDKEIVINAVKVAKEKLITKKSQG